MTCDKKEFLKRSLLFYRYIPYSIYVLSMHLARERGFLAKLGYICMYVYISFPYILPTTVSTGRWVDCIYIIYISPRLCDNWIEKKTKYGMYVCM